MKDSNIWQVLEPMYPVMLDDVPLDGDWLKPPFADDAQGRAIICNDDDFQFVVVDRGTGAVLYVCEDEETLLASSLATLPLIVDAWVSIDRDTVGPEDDEGFTAVKKSFQEQLVALDPPAAAPNEFWALYTDELTSEDYVDIADELDDDLDDDDGLVDDDELDDDDDELFSDTGDNDRPAADQSFADA